MLKIKKIQLSGFRGMLKPHELDFTKGGETSPTSLVLYGLNSSGKTSFVDGIEWFLSPANEIEWLKREDAKERAYPHQEAKDGESFVNIDFSDTEKKLETLRKTYNHKKITQPELSSKDDFDAVYGSFVIRPYLRYLEVIDFVYNRTGLEKYQKLASWMGFENELSFQEKIALEMMPALKLKEKEISASIESGENHLSQLMGGAMVNEQSIIDFCNVLLQAHKVPPAKTTRELWKAVEDFSKAKVASTTTTAVGKLTEVEVALRATRMDDVFIHAAQRLQEGLKELAKEKELVGKIDVIELYTQALDILNKTEDVNTNCPVCGTEWEREKLLAHIQEEMALLKSVKEKKDEITREIAGLKIQLKREQEVVRMIVWRYDEAKKYIPSVSYEKLSEYRAALYSLETSLGENLYAKGVQFSPRASDIGEIEKEKEAILQLIDTERKKIQPSKEELKLTEDVEKLTQIKSKWEDVSKTKNKLEFFKKELETVTALGNALVKIVQDNIKDRFGEMSARIEKYFSILRRDKDIQKIELVLNEAKGKAAGRSAEIQLSYYDIAVKPAYKVLSESLLNSLGLAVYFACVKQFNEDCKFIVLDDIMNSLDIDNRDTVLDLIAQEFGDYQVVLFTHDYFWFQKIMRRFPSWVHKKIKGWDYKGGANIDFAKTTKEEIEELLGDSTTVEDAGSKLGKHIEGSLNELCEKVEAEVKHRYTRNDPPSMEELFDSLYRRLKSKLGKHPVVEKVLEVKKYEPTLRNFTAHPRGNYPSTVSPSEVKRAMEEWLALEKDFWCNDCNRYVEYIQKKDGIECKCGKLKLEKQ